MSLVDRKRAGSARLNSAKPKRSLPSFQDFVNQRDWTGAICFLNFLKRGNFSVEDLCQDAPSGIDASSWLAYCHFHNGDYSVAHDKYIELAKEDSSYHNYAACCLYHLQEYAEAEEEASKAPDSALRTRLLFLCASKGGDENKLLKYHSALGDDLEDHLALLAVRHQRSQYAEAIESCKPLLTSNPNALCLLVYAALCYYGSDNFELTLESLTPYLRSFPTSVLATNIRACAAYRLYSGEAACQELSPLFETIGISDSIDGYLDYLSSLLSNKTSPAQILLHATLFHNIIVFKNGEGALRVLPKLVHDVPEAKLNLAIFYLKAGDYTEAYELLREYEPLKPYEFVLKGLICLAVGQETGSEEHLAIAAQYFQLVGTSDTEENTIQGRQSMAMAYFLNGQYEDVITYLSSIKDFFPSDDDFHFNYGITLAICGQYDEAELCFTSLTDIELKSLSVYCSWLIRCFICNGKPEKAWDVYHENSQVESADSMSFLILIANDCYKQEQYFYSAKAFEVLSRLDPNTEYLLGLKNSCIGVLKKVRDGSLNVELLTEVLGILQGARTRDPTVTKIATVVARYCQASGLLV
ncbi:hypothetical protein GEMRC1_001455 [Eukaryota sp. GEM-RC1]